MKLSTILHKFVIAVDLEIMEYSLWIVGVVLVP